jgi:hypothetical protein
MLDDRVEQTILRARKRLRVRFARALLQAKHDALQDNSEIVPLRDVQQ